MHYRHISRALTIIVGTSLFTVLPAAASVVVFTCAGAITNGGTDRDVFDASVGPGTPFAATFQVDTSAEDIGVAFPNAWDYTDKDPLHEAYVSFGDYGLTPDTTSGALNSLAGSNDSGGPDSLVWESYNSVGGGLTQTWVQADIQDSTATALTAKAIPPVGPGLSDITRWNSAAMNFMATSASNGHRHGWSGTITSINTSVQPSTIPEPGSLSLLALAGLPCLAFVRRWRCGNA